LENVRRRLINEITIDDAGEIILGGKTSSNSYLREIKGINFFDKPKKIKTDLFDVEIDVADTDDRTSYINNHEDIKTFVNTIIENWKPATVSIRKVKEKETLVMAELLRDEYTQVLVGLTSRQNTNVYYVRSVDTGSINVLSSSANYDDDIDWIGVGRINTPYIKTGVTTIKRSVKNVKIPFETRFNNNIYRVLVFTPNNSRYYVTQKDKDGFIVESSALMESEVAWIALNTTQIVNGTLLWKKGIPENETIDYNVQSVNEINKHTSRYVLEFEQLGYPVFDNDDYVVILSSDSNVNLWIENKQSNSVTIRRSYAGEDTKIDFMAVPGDSRWWKSITS